MPAVGAAGAGADEGRPNAGAEEGATLPKAGAEEGALVPKAGVEDGALLPKIIGFCDGAGPAKAGADVEPKLLMLKGFCASPASPDWDALPPTAAGVDPDA